MAAKNKVLCIMLVLIIITVGLLSNAYAWTEELSSGWHGAATGCITIVVDAEKATVTSYEIDTDTYEWRVYAICDLCRGTHKFDFKGRNWGIEGDVNSYPKDVRNTGGGCGFKCLKMDGSFF